MMAPRIVAIALALLLATGGAAVAAPRTSVADVEDEVMCPICGTLLELSSSPQAERERAFVARLVAAGRTKDEIKDALVAEYGDEVLAQPRGAGFELSAYLVPAIAFVLAAGALAVGVLRWRRGGGGPPTGTEGARRQDKPSAADSERVDADLARYDL